MQTLDSPALAPTSPDWRVVWSDDFTGPEGAPLDHDKWRVVTGKPWGAGLETYADDTTRLSLDGRGRLRMTATHTPEDGYVSAWIETLREDFLPEPGGALRVRARVRTAPGLGLDCAMFAWAEHMRHLGDTEPLQGWYRSGEIDVFEVVNTAPADVYGVVHSPECHQLPSLGMGTAFANPTGAPLSDGFHTYTLVWTREPDSLTWYLDDTRYLRLTPEDTTPKGWLFDQRVFFGLLIVIGSPGGPVLPGEPDPAAFPTTMLVDEVSIAEQGPGR
ncbi:glycoside hydrolase family 16 protein [Saccharothrix syringae]|uniref:Glycosyl hydrolase family protein n=1 Tax=Saccharothrix syringae TaxID=103733 RepID=A0A1X9WEQ0_SACSY|nr:family 16 glycosylhydrolase [Saccharothrix syringae]ARS01478.1 NcmE [Saccharothrix syringae]QFZ19278.1 glycosyl hydrolase family protein [Saccharothrix syringae]